jgi:hypothetical protein
MEEIVEKGAVYIYGREYRDTVHMHEKVMHAIHNFIYFKIIQLFIRHTYVCVEL